MWRPTRLDMHYFPHCGVVTWAFTYSASDNNAIMHYSMYTRATLKFCGHVAILLFVRRLKLCSCKLIHINLQSIYSLISGSGTVILLSRIFKSIYTVSFIQLLIGIFCEYSECFMVNRWDFYRCGMDTNNNLDELFQPINLDKAVIYLQIENRIFDKRFNSTKLTSGVPAEFCQRFNFQ